MKIVIFFFFCLYLNVSIGQGTAGSKIDVKNYPALYAAAGDSAVYVIDGNVSNKKLDGINPDDIIYINVIKKEKAAEWFSGSGRNGLVVVVTKSAAITAYQRKLSAFSKEYKDYVEWQMTYNHNDNSILYVILKNGDPKLFGKDELTRELYEIPVTNIVKVELYKMQTCCGTNISVVVTTKE